MTRTVRSPSTVFVYFFTYWHAVGGFFALGAFAAHKASPRQGEVEVVRKTLDPIGV